MQTEITTTNAGQAMAQSNQHISQIPCKPLFAVLNKTRLKDEIDRQGIDRVKADLSTAETYFNAVATASDIGTAYRQLLASLATDRPPEAEMTHRMKDFIIDAQAEDLSRYDLKTGMTAWRNSGEQFAPKTFGQWVAIFERSGTKRGFEVYSRYQANVSDLEAIQERATDITHLDNLDQRRRDSAHLQELTRRVSFSLTYSGAVDRSIEFKAQLGKCRRVPDHRRMDIEREILKAAEVIERRLKPKLSKLEEQAERLKVVAVMRRDKAEGRWSQLSEIMLKGLERAIQNHKESSDYGRQAA